MEKDPRFDAYIKKSAPFAQPILAHIRKVVHASCPDIEETLKWGHPSFMYKGIVCGMASFKEHCAFGFWKGELVLKAVGGSTSMDAMGQFGRITSLKDLPDNAALSRMIKIAVRLNADGVKSPSRIKPKKERPVLAAPAFFTSALKRNAKAAAEWKAFSPSKQREYVEWLIDAKTDATRENRLATAIEWIGEGKSRNWKYERK